MSLGPFQPRSHELLLGLPGSGKTHHARRLMARVRRAVFFDPTGHDYAREGEYVRPADLGPALLRGNVVRLVVVPGDDVPADFRATVAALRASCARNPVVLLADEVGDYASKTSDVLTRLHRNGHHDGVASLLVSQCAVDIPKTCRRTATRVHSLLQVNADDLAALEAQYGPDYASRVRTWQPGAPPVVWTLPTLWPSRTSAAAMH